MEISGKASLVASPADPPAKDEAHGTPSSDRTISPVEKDAVELSANASEIREAVRKVNDLPDVREEKVAELKRRMACGDYRIRNETIASRLIGETVENNAILSRIDTDDG